MNDTKKANAAIVAALKASEAAKRAAAQVREVCRETEAAEATRTEEEMQPLWNRESDVFKACDRAAEAAMQAGMAAARYAAHTCLGVPAMQAAMRAFESALAWIG